MIPYAKTPWSEIIPGLWQGGMYYQEGDAGPLTEITPGSLFKAVFSLDPKWDNKPGPATPHWQFRIPDGELTRSQFEGVQRMVQDVVKVRRVQPPVLVRCAAGLNRSGLVVGLTLQQLGYTPEEAIDLIRKQRSPYALSNPFFVAYIRGEHPTADTVRDPWEPL